MSDETNLEQGTEPGELHFAPTRLGLDRAHTLFEQIASAPRGGTLECERDRAGVQLTARVSGNKRAFKAGTEFDPASLVETLADIEVEACAPEPPYKHARKDEYKVAVPSGTSLTSFVGLVQHVYMQALIEARRLLLITQLRNLLEYTIGIGKRKDLMDHFQDIAIRYNRPAAYQLMSAEDAIFYFNIFNAIHEKGDKLDPSSVIEDAVLDADEDEAADA